jgi:hypothetical protein
LLRIGGKTLIPAETIEGLISGKIVPPPNAGRVKAPEPHDRSAAGRRHRKHPKKPEAQAAE